MPTPQWLILLIFFIFIKLTLISLDQQKNDKGKARMPLQMPSPHQRYLTLSPTPSTASVNEYRMTNGEYIQSSGTSSSTSAEASETNKLVIEANDELKALFLTLQAAADPNEGAKVYDCINLLNFCKHCNRSFTPKAYKYHIQCYTIDFD